MTKSGKQAESSTAPSLKLSARLQALVATLLEVIDERKLVHLGYTLTLTFF